MFRNILTYNKVLNLIVSLNSINMVHNFIMFKISSQMFFHYKAMLRNVFIDTIRMIRKAYKNVSSPFFQYSTTFPMHGIFTCFSKKSFSMQFFNFFRKMFTCIRNTQLISCFFRYLICFWFSFKIFPIAFRRTIFRNMATLINMSIYYFSRQDRQLPKP